MEFVDIVRVKETNFESVANDLLDSGWVLLSSGFYQGVEPGSDHHSYSLGLPKEVALAIKYKEEHGKMFNYGF
ncbi:hypothetical protein [Sporosarcina sp. A2]|uniref:hypothetical protein n=1 Tax=Sporosarcina sp. A2 TaxID=3393449 RepID=UPI003D7B9E4B